MAEAFQRLFTMSGPEARSLNAQAALGPVRQPKRCQFAWLMRHFVERFFNHETASPDGDARARVAVAACASGLPPFLVAVYLWPVYHPFRGWPPGQPHSGEHPTYWLQVNHHFFFIVYSFVAIGIATVFVWDLFFPDLLDLFVLGSLPILPLRAFAARVAAIAVFIAGFLFVSNFLATFVLPMATDPPNLPRFLAGHILACGMSGLFAATSILALQSALLALFGEIIFRKVALALEGLAITVLVLQMLLFPVLTGIVRTLLASESGLVYCFPPFWFLGLYQRLLEGPSTLPIYATLAKLGIAATLAAALITGLCYPLAYLRKLCYVVEGATARPTRDPLLGPLDMLLHWVAVRTPIRRAIFHFITQTLARVPRYRIYLVLYGGVGLSVVTASILRLTAVHGRVRVAVDPDGIRAAIAIVVFWVIAGLRMAFLSPGNQRGRWVFRIVHGNPLEFDAALEQLTAGRLWVLMGAGGITLAALVALQSIAPPQLCTWPARAAQLLIAAGMCLLLTDIFFVNVTTVAFTGDLPRQQPNLAFAVLKYYTFFPVVSVLPVILEPWIEKSLLHMVIVVLIVPGAHWLLTCRHHAVIRDHCNQIALEDDEEDFPMKLGLRY